MTFTNDPKTVETIRDLMMTSREAFVNYTMPLGLHHLIGGNHYAPMPQNAKAPRADWTATYYHQASPEGIGFDRTMQGNKAVGQYFPPVRDMFDNLADLPGDVPALVPSPAVELQAQVGQDAVGRARARSTTKARARRRRCRRRGNRWPTRIDAQRHKEVADRLAIQVADAAKWRDQILKYFQQFSKLPIATEPSEARSAGASIPSEARSAGALIKESK